MPTLLWLLAAYPWLTGSENVPTQPLSARFPAPAGFTRVELPPESFGAFLRELPVRLDRTEVQAWDGRPLDRPAAAVILLDVGNGDRQQCADTILRLHAEWLWSRGRADEASYHFTSGDLSTWKAWRQGERFKVSGAGVKRIKGRAGSAEHDGYRAWLQLVFNYAGTRSLPTDTKAVPVEAPLEPGDLFVQPGGPGHAVVLLDVASDATGRRVGLVGQGFMPAEDLHVLRSDGALDAVWFALPAGEAASLETPAWAPFPRKAARRFPSR